MKCNKCQQEMHQIGPFARRVEEGQVIPKWDGVINHQCTNEECQNYEMFIPVRAGEESTNS